MKFYFIGKYLNLILLIVLGIGIFIYVSNDLKNIEQDGVFVIVRTDRFEGAPDGSFLYLTVFYNGKAFKSSIEHKCNKCEGKYFFAKIARGRPEGRLILYDDQEVPECLRKDTTHPEGWKTIPACSK